MIKRFITALISVLCFVLPATANIKIETDAVDAAIREHFQQEKDKASAVATYKANLAEDGSIDAPSIWKVCVAGGLDIKQPAGKTKCQKFISSLIKSAKVSFYEVCGKDKGKAGGVCVTDFKDIQVKVGPGIAIAQEWARIKKKDEIKCSDNFDGRYVGLRPQDFLKCTSVKSNTYYEFEFNSLEESGDEKNREGMLFAICGLNGSNPVVNGDKTGTDVWSWCDTNDRNVCDNKISVSASKFGYDSQWYDNHADGKKCQINFAFKSRPEDLNRLYGIDPFVFCKGKTQFANSPTVEDMLKRYIMSEAAKQGKVLTEDQIICGAGFSTYRGPGCRVNGLSDYKDDIKVCTVAGKPIDFVFDDVNEFSNRLHKGSMQSMECIVQNGVFANQKCAGINEQDCLKLKDISAKSCPECAAIEWDGKVCKLPDSASVDMWEKGVAYGTLALTVVGGVVVTVKSGGLGGGAAWVAVQTAAGAVMIVSASGYLIAEGVMTWGKFQPFVDEAQECIISDDPGPCAEKIVTEKLQELESYKKNFSTEEAFALDDMFSRLVKLIPEDSKFWDEFAQNPDLWDCTEDGETCRIKTKEQFWQTVSKWSNGLMLVSGIVRAIGVVGAKSMTKTTETIYNTCSKKVMVKSGFKGGQGIRVVSLDGAAEHGGTIISNTQLVEMGLAQTAERGANVKAAQQLLANGAKIGKPFTHTWQQAVGTATNTVINNTEKVAISKAALAGTALTQAHMLIPENDPNSFFITRPGAKDEKGGVIITPEPAPAPGPKPTPEPGTTPNPEPNHTTPNPLPNSTPETTPDVIPVPVVTPTPIVTPAPVVKPTSDKPTTFTPNKQKNTGLIVGLTAAGLVATGAVVGGVVAATSKNKATKTAVSVADSVDSAMENVMHNANNVLGVVDGKQVTLVPLPTTVNTNAKLVEINKNVVAVVGYDGYKLPYYVKNGNWAPLLGIGETSGHWFNVYPKANTGIKKLDMITNLMNQQINPSVVVRYTSFNAGAFALPLAAVSAFGIINSEFPNGVVQSENMTAQEARLYSDNYELMKNKLK